MIYQPSNVTPDMIGEVGNGVTDSDKGIMVSWMVSGNSPLTGYEISILTNDEYSIPLYSTGLRTDNCPFYPGDLDGTPRMMSHLIEATEYRPQTKQIAYRVISAALTVVSINVETFISTTGGSTVLTRTENGWKDKSGQIVDPYSLGITLSGGVQNGDIVAARVAEINNGENLKLKITQKWGNDQTTVQYSDSAFLTRGDPTLTLNSFPSPVTKKTQTFSANYAQAEGDGLNWIRWMVAYADDTDHPIYDSGEVFGATDMEMTFDGFLDGYSYAVRCMIQTQNGVGADTGWTAFPVSVSAPVINGFAEARCRKGSSGILVSWDTAAVIPGIASGDFNIRDNEWLVLNSGNVRWESMNGRGFLFTAPWAFAWRGKLKYESITVYELGQEDGENVLLTYSKTTKQLILSKGDTVLCTISNIREDAEISTLLTENKFYVYYHNKSGGLYPATTLYPSESLYPMAEYIGQLVAEGEDVTYTQSGVDRITVYARQECDYIQLFKGSISEDGLDDFVSGNYRPTYNEVTYAMADFQNGLEAGNLPIPSIDLTGFSVYRKEEGILRHVADTEPDVVSIIDYSAKGDGSEYSYYIYLLEADNYAAQPLVTEKVKPCWWDWSVIECVREGKDTYRAIAEYRFGKNLSSGSISNNAEANVQKTFTKYPSIQMSRSNYKSGSLQSLIGIIDKYANYSDSGAMRDRILELSTTVNSLFLKNRKGDLWKIRISGAITVETNDSSPKQEQTVSIPWTECGSAEDQGIYSIVR